MTGKALVAALLLAVFTLLCMLEASRSTLKVVAGDARAVKYVTHSGAHQE